MRTDVWLVTRERKRGKTYAVRWIDPWTGRMCCVGFGKDKVLAKRMLEDRRHDIRAGISGDVVRAGYDDFVASVLGEMDRRANRPATIAETKRSLLTLQMMCEPRDVAAITVTTLNRFDAERAKGSRKCSTRTCRWPNPVNADRCWKCGEALKADVTSVSVESRRKDIRAIKAALQIAVALYRLPRNVAKDFAQPVADEKLPRALSPNEAKKILDVADEQWETFIYIAATSGPRTGELIGLNWRDIDLDGGTLTLRETKGKKDRLAPLDGHAVKLLERLRKSRLLVGAADKPVFIRTDGRTPGSRWNQNYINRTWPKLIEAAGVDSCCPHDLRKTCATSRAAADVNQRIARGVTGHSSGAVLEKYYQLAEIKVLREAVTKASEPLRRALGGGA